MQNCKWSSKFLLWLQSKLFCGVFLVLVHFIWISHEYQSICYSIHIPQLFFHLRDLDNVKGHFMICSVYHYFQQNLERFVKIFFFFFLLGEGVNKIHFVSLVSLYKIKVFPRYNRRIVAQSLFQLDTDIPWLFTCTGTTNFHDQW